MSAPEHRYSRRDFLAALEQGWKHYLPRLRALPEGAQAQYAQTQGFARIEDVLAHIFAWWERSLERARRLLEHPAVIPPEVHALFAQTIDEFNAASVARYQSWDRAAIEERFTATLKTLEDFLRQVPENELENEHLHRWMRAETIEHYHEHLLPGAHALEIG